MFTKERIAALIIVLITLALVFFPGAFLNFTFTFAAQIGTMTLVWIISNITCKLFLGKSLMKILKEIVD